MSTVVQAPPAVPGTAPGAAGGRRPGAGLISRIRPALLLAPALIVMGGLLLWPLIRVVIISFQDYGLKEMNQGTTNFNGVDNYVELFSSEQLWSTVLPNTVVFAIIAVVSTVAFGTAVAVLMSNLGTLWRTVVGAAIMVAWAMPAVTGTYVWMWFFDTDKGLLNTWLQGIGLQDEPFNWFTNRYTFYAVVLLNIVHHGFPFVAVTVLAGLLGVPKEMLEAAEMDGAGPWRRFWQIIVPNLRQVFTVVIILSTIWDMKIFTQVFLMPAGDGRNRDVINLGTWTFIQSFGQGRYGFGSAIAVVLTLLLLIVTVVYVRTLMKEEEL